MSRSVVNPRVLKSVGITTTGNCHGSLGELWQGPVGIRGDVHIGLIGLHGAVASTAHFTVGKAIPSKDFITADEYFLRHEAERIFYLLTGFTPIHGRWEYKTNVPVGKGMASSTADIVSVVRCLESLHGLAPDDDLLRHVLLVLERSDPVFLDYHCLYLSDSQEKVEQYDCRISYYAFYSYSRDVLPTKSFPKNRLIEFYQEREKLYHSSLEAIRDAFFRADRVAVAQEATESARLAQGYLYDPQLEKLLRIYADAGAVGVIRAHTGSVAGLLFETKPDDHTASIARELVSHWGRRCGEMEVGLK